jgi:hypothetical protein
MARIISRTPVPPSLRDSRQVALVRKYSPGTEQYPEVMIASKGFKAGGGAEAEASCLHKVGRFTNQFVVLQLAITI